MTFIELVKKRKSVRKYLNKPIPKEKLEKVLEAGRLAPSASNRQLWKFIVVQDEKTRQALVEVANGQSFVGEAPCVIVAVALNPEYVMRCEVLAHTIDLAIAVDHMTLAAAEEGLGTCWIGSFYQDKVKQLLQIPDQYKVVALFPLGYPADPDIVEKKRKPLEEIVCYDTFS